jgi:hypothetical protein
LSTRSSALAGKPAARTVPTPAPTKQADDAWRASLDELEQQLQRVTAALRSGDPAALDAASAALHRSLQGCAPRLMAPDARQALALAEVRLRLQHGMAELSVQREAIARAAATLDRGARILLPAVDNAYGAQGKGRQPASTGSAVA